MEETEHAAGTQEEQSATTTEPSAQNASGSTSTIPVQQDSMGANNSVPESTSSLNKDLATPQSQDPKVAEGESSAHAPVATTTVTTAPRVGDDHERAIESDAMMDIDSTAPAEGSKAEEKDIQENSANEVAETNGSRSDVPEQTKEPDAMKEPSSSSAESESTSGKSANPAIEVGLVEAKHEQSTTMDQQTSSDNQQASNNGDKTDHPVAIATSKEDVQPKPEGTGSGTLAVPVSYKRTTAPVAPPPQPVRAYIPQFKFTTFTPMTPLPTRNVTSNFLKTEKNYVLKNIARRRRRKRKAEEDIAQEEDNTTESKGEDEEQKDVANGTLKRKRNDEFSALRRGIFADEEEDEDEDEDNEKDGNVEDDNRKEEEDEYEDSSDSDSEKSVVNEMDENGEAKSVSH